MRGYLLNKSRKGTDEIGLLSGKYSHCAAKLWMGVGVPADLR